MKIFFSILFGLALIVAVLYVVLSIRSHTGQAPGLVKGKLSRCPETDNCVCSEFEEDAKHFVDPLKITPNNAENRIERLSESVIQLGGTVHTMTENYLAATFTSSIFRFVDDLEVRIDAPNHVIHIRSASRVGKSDLGANKKRIEAFKMSHQKLTSS